MDVGIIAIVIGIALGFGISYAVRRFIVSRRPPPVAPPPQNRQQARKLGREARKPRRN